MHEYLQDINLLIISVDKFDQLVLLVQFRQFVVPVTTVSSYLLCNIFISFVVDFETMMNVVDAEMSEYLKLAPKKYSNI